MKIDLTNPPPDEQKYLSHAFPFLRDMIFGLDLSLTYRRWSRRFNSLYSVRPLSPLPLDASLTESGTGLTDAHSSRLLPYPPSSAVRNGGEGGAEGVECDGKKSPYSTVLNTEATGSILLR